MTRISNMVVYTMETINKVMYTRRISNRDTSTPATYMDAVATGAITGYHPVQVAAMPVPELPNLSRWSKIFKEDPDTSAKQQPKAEETDVEGFFCPSVPEKNSIKLASFCHLPEITTTMSREWNLSDSVKFEQNQDALMD
jgi:hypothetical protein